MIAIGPISLPLLYSRRLATWQRLRVLLSVPLGEHF